MVPLKLSSFVSIEKEDEIAYIIIDNGSANTIDDAAFLDLSKLKSWLEENPVKGMIIYGKGRHFSNGANVTYIDKIKDNPQQLEEALNQGKAILNFIEGLPIVTVAAISGACFGAGFEIALSCKYRVCTKNALFSFPETGLGLLPGFAGNIRLPELIGDKKALELILTGNVLSSEDAEKLGIVDQVSNKGEHIECAKQLIKRMTEHVTYEQLSCVIELMNKARQEREQNQNRKELMRKESCYFAKLAEKRK